MATVLLNERERDQEYLQGNKNENDMTAKLLQQTLMSQIEEKENENVSLRKEIESLKEKVKGLQGMYDDEVQKWIERVEELQTY